VAQHDLLHYVKEVLALGVAAHRLKKAGHELTDEFDQVVGKRRLTGQALVVLKVWLELLLEEVDHGAEERAREEELELLVLFAHGRLSRALLTHLLVVGGFLLNF